MVRSFRPDSETLCCAICRASALRFRMARRSSRRCFFRCFGICSTENPARIFAVGCSGWRITGLEAALSNPPGIRGAGGAGAGDLDPDVDPSPNPEDQLVNESRRSSVLLAVVQALPEQDRRCLFLRAEGLAISGDRPDSRYFPRRGIPFFGPISGAHRARRRTVRIMKYEDSHLSDQQLLLDVEGELSAQRPEAVRAHLDACWKCRARRREIETRDRRFRSRPPAGIQREIAAGCRSASAAEGETRPTFRNAARIPVGSSRRADWTGRLQRPCLVLAALELVSGPFLPASRKPRSQGPS